MGAAGGRQGGTVVPGQELLQIFWWHRPPAAMSLL